MTEPSWSRAGWGPVPRAPSCRWSNGTITAVDGPFAEAKELVGGYAVVEVRSRAEAVELGRRLLQIHKDNWPGWEGSCEIRPIFTGEGDTRAGLSRPSWRRRFARRPAEVV